MGQEVSSAISSNSFAFKGNDGSNKDRIEAFFEVNGYDNAQTIYTSVEKL